MKRLLKFLHEIGTVGLMGAIAAQIILSIAALDLPDAEYATYREAIHVVSKFLLLPSLGLVLFTGLLAIAVHPPYHNAGWAWIKALLTVAVLEGTLGGIQGPAREAATLARRIAEGDESARAAIGHVLRHESGALWMIMFLSVVNIALAVWRPKLRRRKEPV
ncbi:MAG: hypothetical protein RIT81_26525 [Deltaproteobacteria bacterium]